MGEEQAFMDGPVTELLNMIDDFELGNGKHIPQDVLDFLGKNRFFSMIIPKKFGGLEFSPYANSTIVATWGAKSGAIAVTVMVPNSLGPGELLMHYGTTEQQDYWLPRLADGRDIPCFALTSPEAGSDAGAIPDAAIVTKGEFNGEEVLGLRVSWDKRYITLAPIATVLGLAFKVFDPDQLLGDKLELGITLPFYLSLTQVLNLVTVTTQWVYASTTVLLVVKMCSFLWTSSLVVKRTLVVAGRC